MDQNARALMLVLIKARTLISSEENWLPQGYAADADGNWASFRSKEAVRFTVLGAVMRAGRGSTDLFAAAREVFAHVSPKLFAKLTSFEGALTYAESLSLLDAAVGIVASKHPSGFISTSKMPIAEASPWATRHGARGSK